MAKKSKVTSIDFRKLTASLQEFASSLPAAVEKEQLHRSLSEIIAFLSEIQSAIAAVPSREDTAEMDNALHAFERFTAQAKTNPAIAALLGIPPPRPSKPKAAAFTEEEAAAAQRLLSEMQVLQIDQMRSRLHDETAIPLRSLQTLAAELGIRSVQRTGRDVLVHQISSKISNYRGYQKLREGTESP